MTGISRIMVSSAEVVIGQVPDGKTEQGRTVPGLMENQVVDARVLKTLAPRRFELLIAGRKVIAESHFPLRQDDRIRLQVLHNGARQVFRFMDSHEKGCAFQRQRLLTHVGRPGPYENLLKMFSGLKVPENGFNSSGSENPGVSRMASLFSNLALKPGAPGPAALKKLVSDSGLNWEHKLRSLIDVTPDLQKGKVRQWAGQDLKALAASLLTEPGALDNDAVRHLESFVDDLEQLQILNSRNLESSGRFLMPLPFMLDDMLKFGQLLIDFGRKKAHRNQNEEHLVRVSLLLDMTNIGDVRADFSILKKSISGSFGVGTPEIRDIVRQKIPLLADRLKAMQFEVHTIDCRLIRPETLSSTSLIDQLMDMDSQTLNLMI